MNKEEKTNEKLKHKETFNAGEPITLSIKMVIVDVTGTYAIGVWFDEHYIEHRYKIEPIKSEDAGS